jgi:hypothetical protein
LAVIRGHHYNLSTAMPLPPALDWELAVGLACVRVGGGGLWRQSRRSHGAEFYTVDSLFSSVHLYILFGYVHLYKHP